MTRSWHPGHEGKLLVACALLCAIAFSRRFLDAAHTVPRLDRVLAVLLGAGLASFVLAWFSDPYLSGRLATLLGMTLVVTVLPAGILALRRGYRAARWFVLAWSVFLVCAFLNGLMLFGFAPHNSEIDWFATNSVCRSPLPVPNAKLAGASNGSSS